jgi:hypothetical protein
MSKEQLKKQQSVLKLATATGDYKSAASIYGYNGINPGRFSLTNHTQNPHNGNHSYGVSFDLAAAKYYNKIAGVEWVKWNQEKARIAAAQLQGERNAREFIAKLPNATAEDKEQLTQVKQRQAQVKQYGASLRQHLAKHERIASKAPVEKLNFNNQYVVPGSLSHLSQPSQPQISPQTILSSQPSNNPFTIPGTQQGEEASQYWANLYVQGEQQGGFGGAAKQFVAFPMGMLSSLWTKDTALATALTLGTSGLGALAGAGKLGAASMPTIRAMQIGGAFQSGTSIGQGISGKNMWTGEELSPLDRGFHLTFGALGAGLDLGGAGLQLGNLSKSMPTFSRLIEGVSPQNATLQSGRLGNQMGAVRLGDSGKTPESNIELVNQGNRSQSGEQSITPDQSKAQHQSIRAGTQKEKYVKWAKAYGEEVGSYDAVTPGPLSNPIASTFSGGRYSVIKLEKNIPLYRVWSKGTSRELGGYWSLEKPSGSLQSRIDYALLPEWAEIKGTSFRAVQATNWVKINVPKGSTIYIGEVGNQGGSWMGGRSQVLLEERPLEDWIQQRGSLK